MIDLSDADLKTVKAILKKNIPNRTVVVFGSRIKGTAKKFSDLDLCIMDEPLSISELSRLNEDFSESNLTIKVEIVNWKNIDPEFQEIINQKNEIIQSKILKT